MLGHYVQKKVMEFNFWKKISHCPKRVIFTPIWIQMLMQFVFGICLKDFSETFQENRTAEAIETGNSEYVV